MIAKPWRRLNWFAIFWLAIAVGGGIGATLSKQKPDRFEAAGAVILSPSKQGLARLRFDTNRVIASTKLNEVVAGAIDQAQLKSSISAIRNRLRVKADTNSGMVEIIARGHTSEEAVKLADAVISTTALFNSRALQDHRDVQHGLRVSSFETGVAPFGTTSPFSLPPESETIDPSITHYGQPSLRITCAASAGCGPSAKIFYSFESRSQYILTAWARSQHGAVIRAAVGRDGHDVVTGPVVQLGDQWKRVVAYWYPRSSTEQAWITFQTQQRKPVSFHVNNVVLVGPSPDLGARMEPLTVKQESLLFSKDQVKVSMASARPIQAADPNTLVWASTGALLLGGLTVVLKTVVSRRGRHSEGKSQDKPGAEL